MELCQTDYLRRRMLTECAHDISIFSTNNPSRNVVLIANDSVIESDLAITGYENVI